MPRAPVHPEGKGKKRADPYTKDKPKPPPAHHTSSSQSGPSATAAQQISIQHENEHRPDLALGQFHGHNYAQPGVGSSTHLTPYYQSAALHHQQPDHQQQQQQQHQQGTGAYHATSSNPYTQSTAPHHLQPYQQQHQQHQHTPGTGLYYATYENPYTQSSTFPHQPTNWNSDTRPAAPWPRPRPRYAQGDVTEYEPEAYLALHGLGPAAVPNQHPTQPSHASGHTLHHDVPNSGAQWHESRDLAEVELSRPRANFTIDRIIMIKAFARGADFRQKKAYLECYGFAHHHCPEDNCLAPEHEEGPCKVGFGTNAYMKHYRDVHPDIYLFRCYIKSCPRYYNPHGGWNEKKPMLEHIKAHPETWMGSEDQSGSHS